MVRLPTSFRGGLSRIFRAHMFLLLRRHSFRNIVRRVKQPLRDTIPWQATWNMLATTKAGCANLKLPGLRKTPQALPGCSPPHIWWLLHPGQKKQVPWRSSKVGLGLENEFRPPINQVLKLCPYWMVVKPPYLSAKSDWNHKPNIFSNNKQCSLVSTTISVGYPLLISHSYWKLPCHSWVNHHLYISFIFMGHIIFIHLYHSYVT